VITFTCVCCGHSQEFVDAEEAFNEGWDAPPHFTGFIACSLCPASFIVSGQTAKHNEVHARWGREGRPDNWSQETCLSPEDRVPESVLDQIRNIIRNRAHDE
jgi:hypothetical protein